MVQYILSNNVLEMNGATYMWGSVNPQGLSRNIPVAGTVIEGVYWKRPTERYINSTDVTYCIEAVDPTAPSTPRSHRRAITR